MTTVVWNLVGALLAALLGLVMLFWALERSSLVAFHGAATGQAMRAPVETSITLFVGLIIINFSVFYALSVWSRYLRENPDTRQLPVWLLFSVAAVSGAALITGIANHSAYVQSHDVIPMDIDHGFIAYQVVTAAFVLIPLVFLGVRWSPGYRPSARES